MLTPPDLSTGAIVAYLRETYGLAAQQADFLPLGADINTFVFRVEMTDGAACFLKLRSGAFDDVVVAAPAWLHAQGIQHVLAPLPTLAGEPWAHAHGFAWLLYPFMEGKNGYEVALSQAQSVAFGRCLRAIHDAILPDALHQRIPREVYAPQWRDMVAEYTRQVETREWDDPIAQHLSNFWKMKRHEIRAMVERASSLAETLRSRADAFVLCHGDLHPGNLLIGANEEFAIVDWDTLTLAPKERDLMCLGGGFTTTWGDAQEAWFYQGYGATEIDPLALAYYRYERVIADFAAYGEQILEAQGSIEDREVGLRQLMSQFLPGEVIDIAHQTYAAWRASQPLP